MKRLMTVVILIGAALMSGCMGTLAKKNAAWDWIDDSRTVLPT